MCSSVFLHPPSLIFILFNKINNTMNKNLVTIMFSLLRVLPEFNGSFFSEQLRILHLKLLCNSSDFFAITLEPICDYIETS